MPTNFSNPSLQQALWAFRKEQNNGNLLKVAQALLNTQVMAPAKWDKEPETDENGAIRFAPDTTISLMVVTNPQGGKYFPMFTDMEEVRKFYQDAEVQCLILTMQQYLPFLTGNPEVSGIVVDPKGADIPFNTQFLEGVANAGAAGGASLQQNTIHKGDHILLKNVDASIADLEAELISSGYHDPAIRAIYIKERIEDRDHPEKTHWFIVVDSDELDTGIFTRIGNRCKTVCHGKDMEFMFTNQKLGQDVAASSKAIYQRA
ncbi:MAG: enhanced serine sensitivity protein SseB C-terminal domain-containing protein [Ileibacterium sp.]|nr:enhanced serine sensitivity protein SseB C-terminal domain-containing protein [Ileibacterium sp.]